MKNKNYMYKVGLLALLCVSSIHSSPWKQAAKTIFGGGCTLLGGTIALAPGFKEANAWYKAEHTGFEKLKKNMPLSLPSKEEETKIKTLLDTIGCANPQNVHIAIRHSSTDSAGPNNLLLLKKQTLENLLTLDENDLLYQQAKADIAHEISHLNHNDPHTAKYYWSGTSLFTLSACKAIKRLRYSSSFLKNPSWFHHLKKIPAGGSMALLSMAGVQLLFCRNETRADRESTLYLTADECCAQSNMYKNLYLKDLTRWELTKKEIEKNINTTIEKNKLKLKKKGYSDEMVEKISSRLKSTLSGLNKVLLDPLTANLSCNHPFLYKLKGNHPTHNERAEFFEKKAREKLKEEKANNQA